MAWLKDTVLLTLVSVVVKPSLGVVPGMMEPIRSALGEKSILRSRVNSDDDDKEKSDLHD